VASKQGVSSQMPSGWREARLSDVTRLKLGRTPSRANFHYWAKQGVPWVSIADLNFGTVLHTKETISSEALDKVFRGSVSPAGTLLLSFKLTIGKVGIIGMPATHNEAIVSVFPNAEDADRDFLFFLFQEMDLAVSEDTYVKGKTLNMAKLQSLQVILPPVPEQRAIANVLMKARKAREKCDQVVASTQQLKRCLIDHLFGLGPIPLDSHQEQDQGAVEGLSGITPLGTVRLSDVAAFPRETIDPRGSPEEEFEYYSIPAYQAGGLPVVELGHKIMSQKLLVSDETVLFGKLNPRVPKVWRVQPSATRRRIASTEFIPMIGRPGFTDAVYLYYLCWSRYVLEQAQGLVSGSTPSRQRVDMRAFTGLRVPLFRPADQHRIAEVLSALDAKLDAEQKRQRALDSLFASLLHNLITGQVRLPDFKES
jgi:type I restriction enzyme S subunit